MTVIGHRPSTPRALAGAALSRLVPRTDSLLVTTAGAVALVAVAAEVRTRALGGPLWLDEGLSVGIASHPLADIPGLLREDGSPPLYYLLLHVWMALAGSSETAVHLLSVVFGLAAVPLALWLGRTLFGARAGWVCGVLAALNPLLSFHSQEARMYSLDAFLSLAVAGAFVGCFVQRRARFAWLHAAALSALLYTHNWALFLVAIAGTVAAVLVVVGPDRRALARSCAIGFGVPALAYLPWLPTLAFQTAHTGAPWSITPDLGSLRDAASFMIGPSGPLAVLLVGAGTAAIALWTRGASGRPDLRAGLVLAALGVGTILLAWVYNQHAAGWASRYLNVALGPVLLLGGLALARAGTAGLVGLAFIVPVWFEQPPYHTVAVKSNADTVIERVAPTLRRGDVALVAQPEAVPLVRYYLGPGPRYLTPLGPVPDTRVMDWRDVQSRLRRAPIQRIVRLVDGLAPGTRIALVQPLTGNPGNWQAPWTHLVRRRNRRLAARLKHDPRLVVITKVPAGTRGSKTNLRATVFEHVGAGGAQLRPGGRLH